MIKRIATIHVFFVLISALILAASVRGLSGNPDITDLSQTRWREDGPFELSPERGRFALLYSFVEDHSLSFSIPLARFSAPDIALSPEGKYVSLFMPGISFLVIPGYYAGKYLGVSQVGTFAVISFFALLNVILIYAIVMRLCRNKTAAALAGFTFLFATPAFPYAVSLYQHHVSVFIILLAIYLLSRWKNLWVLPAVWFLCAASVLIDNPNIFLMLPVGIYATGRLIRIEKNNEDWRLSTRPLGALTFLTMLLPIIFFLWFNQASYGNPFQLPGTLPSVKAIDQNGNPIKSEVQKVLTSQEESEIVGEKTLGGFFNTRGLLSGFYIHFLSPDRGVIVYSPVILLGIAGLILLYRNHKNLGNMITAVIGINILLYSMWGDPWGGWAFGSRYLIPTYALLSIGLGTALNAWKRKVWLLGIFLMLFLYSAGVNTLGALTSNMNPPHVQVLSLEKLSGQEQKYTYARNWQYLTETGSKSFVFENWAREYLDARQYYFLMYALVVAAGLTMTATLVFYSKKPDATENNTH